MLTDEVRVGAWRQAMAELVRPGDAVADVGAGAGLLSVLACKAGARRVYAIEDSRILEVARDVIDQAGLKDKVVLLPLSSRDVILPEQVDVVLCELLGSFGLNGGLLPTLVDARRRFLRSGGRVGPCAVELCLAPVEMPEWRRKFLDCWERVPELNLAALRRRAANSLYYTSIPTAALLSPPAEMGRIALTDPSSGEWAGQTEFVVSRPGRLDGIGGWCTSWMTADISVTNSPFAARSVDWGQALLGLEEPVEVSAGDRVAALVRATQLGPWTVWSWRVRIRRPGAADLEFSHSSLPGELISLADMYRQSPEFVPKLSPRGRAAWTALGLADGSHTAGQIRDEVTRLFPDVFPDSARAARLVSGLILSLCEDYP
jgi:protein arginine N-methyltransferase 1